MKWFEFEKERRACIGVCRGLAVFGIGMMLFFYYHWFSAIIHRPFNWRLPIGPVEFATICIFPYWALRSRRQWVADLTIIVAICVLLGPFAGWLGADYRAVSLVTYHLPTIDWSPNGVAVLLFNIWLLTVLVRDKRLARQIKYKHSTDPAVGSASGKTNHT